MHPLRTIIERMFWLTLRQAKRLVILVVGITVVLFGIVLLVTPGPAFVVIPIGLGILSIEFVWARRLLVRVKQQAIEMAKTAAAVVSNSNNSRKPNA